MTTDTMPDSTDIEAMGLAEVRVELERYQPATSSSVIAVPEYMARRARLWARLDALLGVTRPGAARPVAGS